MPTYAITYTLRYFGTVLTGPNAGKKLDGYRLESFDSVSESEECALARARMDKDGRFDGRIEVLSKQYFSRKPALTTDQEWTGKPRGAGFVLTLLHTL